MSCSILLRGFSLSDEERNTAVEVKKDLVQHLLFSGIRYQTSGLISYILNRSLSVLKGDESETFDVESSITSSDAQLIRKYISPFIYNMKEKNMPAVLVETLESVFKQAIEAMESNTQEQFIENMA